MEKLFRQFSRIYVEDKPITEGTGLGQYLTKNLVQLLKGRIQMESEYRKGSTFTFMLPFKYEG